MFALSRLWSIVLICVAIAHSRLVAADHHEDAEGDVVSASPFVVDPFHAEIQKSSWCVSAAELCAQVVEFAAEKPRVDVQLSLGWCKGGALEGTLLFGLVVSSLGDGSKEQGGYQTAK